MSEEKIRLEKDSMGEFKVPENVMYGASTARAVENFPISDLRFKRSFIRALGEIKRACAIVNEKNKLLDKKIAHQIVKSAELVSEGEFREKEVSEILRSAKYPVRSLSINLADLKAQIAACEKGINEIKHATNEIKGEIKKSSSELENKSSNITKEIKKAKEDLDSISSSIKRDL